MRSHLVVLTFVSLAFASSHHSGWKDNTEYVYQVSGRSLTSLYQLSDQYSGIFLKAKLHVSPRPDGKLQARISDAQYAQIHSHLHGGWNTHVPESELNYKQVGLSGKPFQLISKNGLINSLIVEKETPNFEANLIKSIVSQLQLDLNGNNAIHSPINNFPDNDEFEGVFKTMEETITGETETQYEIHGLPEYLIQSQPWLVPQRHLKGDGQIYEVIKSKNYTNSGDMPAYHYGFGELTEGEPSSNRMGQFFTRQSSSRVILTGKPSKYAIQYSQTVDKIIINPTLSANQRGSAITALNLTLTEVKSQDQQPQELSNPYEIGNLVYTYERPFAQSNEVHQKSQGYGKKYDSSEEETESTQSTWRRYRRSAEQLIRKMHQNDDDRSDSSSEENIQYQRRPEMSEAPECPLLPYYMGYQGRSIKANSQFDIKQNVQKIAREISEDLQQPEKILTQSTLSKYAMLCSLLRVMDQEEMRSVAQQLYSQDKQGEKRLAWVAFRDAVAEAGTGPAFLNIEEWISTKKIENEEAAEIVASMAHGVRVPTEEYLEKFFEFVKKSEVKHQEYLNETALLSYTRLLNKVSINKRESYNQYPVYSFTSFYTEQGKEFVKNTVIPYLSQQLDNAVAQADSRKIHVYIRALGNVGHKKILEAYEPYLEGEKQVSQFQRMLMVLSFDKLVESNPVVARSVLYRIYQNTAEVPEVRVVAVYQLMRTNMPVEMLQRMAENTNTDDQEEVNAAVKSAIENASQLKGREAQALRKSAESARPLLTRKQYKHDQSQNLLQDFIVKNMNMEFKQNYLQVGSSESYLPKGIKYSLRSNINGMKQYFGNAQAMVSSIRELTNVLYQQTEDQQSRQQSREGKLSSAKIAEALNLETTEREQLEGYLYSEIASMQRIWSFDNETIKQLPQAIREREQMLKNGKQFQYTKLKQRKEMALSLPTEMGLPFLYTYDIPMVVQFEGQIKAVANPEISRVDKLNAPEQVSAQFDGYVTVSAKAQSQLSVVTPFDQQIFTAGFDKNLQVHLPLKFNAEIDVEKKQVKIEGELNEKHQDARLFHYSTWPYTSRSDVMNLSPVALRPHTYHLKPQRNSHKSFDAVLGRKETGMSFRVWGHYPQKSLDFGKLLSSEGIAGAWQEAWESSTLHQTEANIRLDPQQTTSRKFKLQFGYQNQYNSQPQSDKPEQFLNMDELSSKIEQDSQQRHQELCRHVSAGIKNSRTNSFDASLEFEGGRKHIFMLACAKSNVDARSRIVAAYKNNAQNPINVNLQIKGYSPNTNEIDVTHSLNNEPKAKYEVLFKYGQSEQDCSQVSATIDMKRSESRRQYLEEQPMYHVCKKQMQEGNNYQAACQNISAESDYCDDIRVELQYENIPKRCLKKLEMVANGIRLAYYPMAEIKDIQQQDKIQVRVQFEPEDLYQANVTVRANGEETRLSNVYMGSAARNTWVGAGKDNYEPSCVIDESRARTFSNKTYPLSLGEGWTLMMQYIPQAARGNGQHRLRVAEQLRKQPENLMVLVRELSDHHKEIKVIFNDPTTEDKSAEIYMQYKEGSFPTILVDNEEAHYDEKKAADFFDGYVEVYGLPNYETKLEIQNWFYIIYDGSCVKLTATSDKLYDSIVGLCGRFSNDKNEDFWTPNNCIVRSPKAFVESFKVEGSRQNQQHQECIRKELPLYTDVITGRDVERKGNHQEHNDNGIRLRNRYIEENGEICFTIRPVAECKSQARKTISKNVPVHCVSKSKTAYYLKNQIDQGGNPDFSHKPESKTMKMEISQDCY